MKLRHQSGLGPVRRVQQSVTELEQGARLFSEYRFLFPDQPQQLFLLPGFGVQPGLQEADKGLFDDSQMLFFFGQHGWQRFGGQRFGGQRFGGQRLELLCPGRQYFGRRRLGLSQRRRCRLGPGVGRDRPAQPACTPDEEKNCKDQQDKGKNQF